MSACSKNSTTINSPDDISVVIGGLGNVTISGQSVDSSKLGYLDTKVGALSYVPHQFIVSAKNDEELRHILSLTNGKLIDDGKLPKPPSYIPKSEIRNIERSPRQLIEVKAPNAKVEDFKTLMRDLKVSGEIKVASQETLNEYVLMRRLAQEKGIEIEPNIILSSSLPSQSPTSKPRMGNVLSNNSYDHNFEESGFNVKPAWNAGYTGRGVQIAVIDTGFVAEDYDMTGYNPISKSYYDYQSIYPKLNRVSGYNFTAGEPNPYTTITGGGIDNGKKRNTSIWHGFHVAQTAAGTRNNNYGGTGVAYDAQIYLFRVGQASTFFRGSYSYYDAGRAVDTAINWGADVINMSFGGLSPAALGVPNTHLGASLASAERAGVINIAAAGNETHNFSAPNPIRWIWALYPIPAAWDTVISVGSVDVYSKNRASYSNYGSGVSIFGPSTSDSALNPGDCSSFMNDPDRCAGSIIEFDGTSNAAPFVAGAAALMKQAKPSLTNSQVKNILIKTATKNAAGENVINVWAAVQEARK